MNEELASLKENETWELVKRPINAKVIQNCWVMRVKNSCDGSITGFTGFDDGSVRVCRLKRSLYGLKQAPWCWNKQFINFMKKDGLKNSTLYPCLFYRTHEDSYL